MVFGLHGALEPKISNSFCIELLVAARETNSSFPFGHHFACKHLKNSEQWEIQNKQNWENFLLKVFTWSQMIRKNF